MDIKQDKSFKCAHCEKGFTTKKYLKYHTEAHDDNAQVNCEVRDTINQTIYIII